MEELREGDKMVISLLDFWYEVQPDLVIKWIESQGFVKEEDVSDFIMENRR